MRIGGIFFGVEDPYEAWPLGCQLVATLDMANFRDQALHFVNWLQAAFVKRGYVAGD
jgi:hypothetical protein